MQIIEAKCPAANEICSLIVGWVSSSADTIAAPFIIHFIQKMIQNGFCFRFKEKPNEIPQQKNYTKPICTYKHAIVRGYEKKSSQNKQKKSITKLFTNETKRKQKGTKK